MWSAALDAILTTLRYLAPATLLTLFWGQQSFLFKLLKHIDSAFRAIVFSSEEQKQAVIKWLADVGPVRVESLDTVWRHGWIVCGVLDEALPGACAGHPPTRLSLKHAQAIADHYLGVEPVFSRQELDSNDALSKHQEWKLATYLDRIRLSLSKLTPPVSKPGSQRTSPETTQFTLDYVAKGSGLAAAQVYQKMSFKIYPTAQQSLDPGEIAILIRGPKDTYGMTVLPPILGKAQLIRQKLLGLQSTANYTENILPITQGATYLRSYGKTDMNKTYYIPKTKYDIEIETDSRADHTKISYIVSIEGRYEISITSRGQNIVGSPFSISASHNILSCLQRDSFYLEDGEEIDIVDVKTDRKVVLRIVDFVTEKMLLKENGSLEKITDDEAKILMATESINVEANTVDENNIYKTFVMNEAPTTKKNRQFNNIAKKVILLSRVCNVFNDIVNERRNTSKKENKCLLPRSQKDIPDIVNSTFTETNINPFMLVDVRDKYIIPENISVSLKTEKSLDQPIINVPTPESTPESDQYENITEQARQTPSSLFTFEDDQEDDILMVITSSSSNPFLADTYADSFVREKELGAFVRSEYERNNSQNEETPDELTKIMFDENSAPSPNLNPFIVELERPKTPVYKIITGDLRNREDSVYIDSKSELLTEEILGNEFINPFFIHQHLQTGHIGKTLPTTDFIIGAPVSSLPVIRASTPEPNFNSLIIASDNENIVLNVTANLDRTDQGEQVKITNEEFKSEFSTPLHTNITLSHKMDNNSTSSSTFHSLDSENIEILNLHTSNNQFDAYKIDDTSANSNLTPKKDMWDSAYVSIDENNSSPDTNNNDNTQVCEAFNKQKFSPSDDTFGLKRAELINMGPAERELWQTCNELKDDAHKTPEEIRPNKWEIRRPMFTPIIEENDRSISSSVKETSLSKIGEADQVTVAFAELNDIYHDYFPNSETGSTTTTHDDSKLQSLEVDNTIATIDVNSASEIETDVKRQTKELEGKISEVQINATESYSVSQPLPYPEGDNNKDAKVHSKNETQFGDNDRTNIVLEKKKYWDDRIRQIQAKSLESTTHQKKRRLSSKHLRHNDSLTKRRGKQIIKNFLSAGDLNETAKTPDSLYCESPIDSFHSLEETRSDMKLVDKWKMYWDNKLETEKSAIETTCCRVISPKNKMYNDLDQYTREPVLENKNANNKAKSSTLPAKQELSEEVFKAFETSPKRFFGTSRKQILNKIDTFLGKPHNIDVSSKDVSDTTHDSGLVSSRISLFHSISNTEELPWSRRKCQSLHNIYQRKDSEKNADASSLENKLNDIVKNKIQSVTESKVEIIDSSVEEENSDQETANTLKEKRTRIAFNGFNKSFDESVYQKQSTEKVPTESDNIKKATASKQNQHINKYKKATELRKKSFSKSEMDIFNKSATQAEDDGLDKHKSCEDLPKISVKNFITLFEGVSKTSVNSKSVGKTNKINSEPKKWHADSSYSGTVNKPDPTIQTKIPPIHINHSIDSASSKKTWINKSAESISSNDTYAKSITDSIDIEIISNQDLETSQHLSLSDIELEIVEISPEKSTDSSPKRGPEGTDSSTDYKTRFKTAKEFFQSLEELREPKKPRKMNECELLLRNKSTESAESQDSDRPQRRVKRNIKSHSMPSSEISKIWNQLQEKEGETSACKLVKISEKFHVDDLFNDVTEGKLSRQGSLRGIPHKKAVLEAFKSMENVADNVSPYEIAVTHLNDFAKENQVKNAQTYLSEYPYLPTTDPSKYQSRLDVKASGLISLKELINKKPRRNSVPDLRLNPTFTVDL